MAHSCALSRFIRTISFTLVGTVSLATTSLAQEKFPEDDPVFSYHSGPAYRDSESHPLRIVAYALHPVGWLAQEVFFRPLSYFTSSTHTTRAIFGYKDPYSFRKPECFSSDSTTPNCHLYVPFNYQATAAGSSVLDTTSSPEAALNSTAESSAQGEASDGGRQVYLPDVNFDFNSHQLTPLGEGRVHQIAQLLNKEPGLTIVLEGNADQRGTDAYNEKLGLNRAEAVRSKLVELGVSADRISTVSFGKSKPVFAEEADWARAVNRRVAAQSSH